MLGMFKKYIMKIIICCLLFYLPLWSFTIYFVVRGKRSINLIYNWKFQTIEWNVIFRCNWVNQFNLLFWLTFSWNKAKTIRRNYLTLGNIGLLSVHVAFVCSFIDLICFFCFFGKSELVLLLLFVGFFITGALNLSKEMFSCWLYTSLSLSQMME